MGTDPLLEPATRIVFFDDKCLLCSRFVRFTLHNVKNTLQNVNYTLHFAGIESKTARELLPLELIEHPETVVFLENRRLYIKSEAIFKILTYLKFPISGLRVFRFLPTSWTDLVYNWVAKNRTRWFGRSPQCFLPPRSYQDKFLD